MVKLPEKRMFKKFPQCPKTREVAQRAECSLHSAGSVRTSSPEVPVSSIQYPVSRVQRPKCRSPVSSVQRIRRLVEVEELTNHKDPIAGLPSPYTQLFLTNPPTHQSGVQRPELPSLPSGLAHPYCSTRCQHQRTRPAARKVRREADIPLRNGV